VGGMYRDSDRDVNEVLRLQELGLPCSFQCANLKNCAVLCAERECVREFYGVPGNVLSGRAGVAQLVEHLICNQRVGGSNPFASST
jgi:hypothetical protein